MGEVIFVHGDIASEQVLTSFVETVIKEYGKVDF